MATNPRPDLAKPGLVPGANPGPLIGLSWGNRREALRAQGQTNDASCVGFARAAPGRQLNSGSHGKRDGRPARHSGTGGSAQVLLPRDRGSQAAGEQRLPTRLSVHRAGRHGPSACRAVLRVVGSSRGPRRAFQGRLSGRRCGTQRKPCAYRVGDADGRVGSPLPPIRR